MRRSTAVLQNSPDAPFQLRFEILAPGTPAAEAGDARLHDVGQHVPADRRDRRRRDLPGAGARGQQGCERARRRAANSAVDQLRGGRATRIRAFGEGAGKPGAVPRSGRSPGTGDRRHRPVPDRREPVSCSPRSAVSGTPPGDVTAAADGHPFLARRPVAVRLVDDAVPVATRVAAGLRQAERRRQPVRPRPEIHHDVRHHCRGQLPDGLLRAFRRGERAFGGARPVVLPPRRDEQSQAGPRGRRPGQRRHRHADHRQCRDRDRARPLDPHSASRTNRRARWAWSQPSRRAGGTRVG